MKINYTKDIRKAFKKKYKAKEFTNGTVELQSVQFNADASTIFGGVNQDYITSEILWYKTCSRKVDDLATIYGKRVAIWDSVADKDGYINSNYGWCIYSQENGYQYDNVLNKLWNNPTTRQAVMIYTRPTMHIDALDYGMKDFMCTNTVQYFINDNYLDCQVNMRSNDAVFGFNNDYAWQKEVLKKLADDLSHAHGLIKPGIITWNVGSMHVYERHYHMI